MPYSLAFLRTNSAGSPVLRAHHRRDRDAAELEPAEQLGALRQQVDHLRGDAVEQRRLGLEEVLVEVGVRDLSRAEGELPGQAAGGVDVGGEGGVRWSWGDPAKGPARQVDRTGVRPAPRRRSVDRGAGASRGRRRHAMFVQVFQGPVSDPAQVKELLDRWVVELGPSADGWLGSTGGVTDEGWFIGLARFDSEERRATQQRPPRAG